MAGYTRYINMGLVIFVMNTTTIELLAIRVMVLSFCNIVLVSLAWTYCESLPPAELLPVS